MPCCSGHAHAHNHTNTTGYYEDMDTEWGPLSYEPFAEPGACGMLLVLLVLLTGRAHVGPALCACADGAPWRCAGGMPATRRPRANAVVTASWRRADGALTACWPRAGYVLTMR